MLGTTTERTEMKKCNDCKYWACLYSDEGRIEVGEGMSLGKCHRYPPVFVGGCEGHSQCSENGDVFMHVETYEDNWCGEYKSA
jgi:hypothetical protein